LHGTGAIEHEQNVGWLLFDDELLSSAFGYGASVVQEGCIATLTCGLAIRRTACACGFRRCASAANRCSRRSGYASIRCATAAYGLRRICTTCGEHAGENAQGSES
jgi:hypothetical protein